MQCKFCKFVASSQQVISRHHRLGHGRVAHWPCFHIGCVCTFKTPGALKSHISRSHSGTVKMHEKATFFWELCDFRVICSFCFVFNHLGHHLRNQKTVHWPFLRCVYKSNNYKTFNCHRSRKHKNHTLNEIQTCVSRNSENDAIDQPSDACVAPETSQSVLREKLCENVFLACTRTALHVSKSAIQKIVEEFHDILHFSKCNSLQRIKEVLSKHNIQLDDFVVHEIN